MGGVVCACVPVHVVIASLWCYLYLGMLVSAYSLDPYRHYIVVIPDAHSWSAFPTLPHGSSSLSIWIEYDFYDDQYSGYNVAELDSVGSGIGTFDLIPNVCVAAAIESGQSEL